MRGKEKFFLTAFMLLLIGIAVCFVDQSLHGGMDEEGYFEISTPSEYRDFWEMAAMHSDIKGRLMADITLNELSDFDSWPDLPPEYCSPAVEFFTGVFDGNGHTVYGIYSENGYGLVRENAGIITNLSIKDSFIRGGYSNGGICYANHKKVSNCRFEGTIFVGKEEDAGRLGGICIINCGFIEECSYAGTMVTAGRPGSSYSGDMAGICVENRCSIYGCYNLTMNQRPYYSNSYAISDVGMENCYARADGGWKISEGSHIIKLDEEQLYAVSELAEGDLSLLVGNSLLEDSVEIKGDLWRGDGRKEVLADQVVSRLIRRLVEWGEAEFSEIKILSLSGQNIEQQGFGVELALRQGTLEIEAYPAEGIADDYERLIKTCDACMDGGSWSHQTYQLTRFFEREDGTYYLTLDELEEFLEPEALVLYQTEAESGFFYAAEGMLYHITSSGSLLEKRVFETLSEERDVQDGIEWEDKWVQDEVYRQLEDAGKGTGLFSGDEEENRIFCREEIMGLTELTITGIGNVESFDDLAYMPELAELHLTGSYEEAEETNAMLRFQTAKDSLPKLKSLTIEDAWIRKWRFDWESLTGLENLTLIKCWIWDADELRCLKQLKSLHIYTYTLEDISFLEDMPLLTDLSLNLCKIQDLDDIVSCKRLKRLSLSFNKLEDISALAELTELEELDLQANSIENIEVLTYLKKLKKIDLSYNQIMDLTPLQEKEGLESLYLLGNRVEVQDWGELIYIPDVAVGWGYREGDYETAEQVVEQLHPDADILIEDVDRGDFNQDGIEDMAVVGFQIWESAGGNTFFVGERRAYLFQGTAKGWKEIQTFSLSVPEELNENNWTNVKDGLTYSIVLSENHLVIQTHSLEAVQDVDVGGSFRITEIYTWDKDKMKPECRNETKYDSADR